MEWWVDVHGLVKPILIGKINSLVCIHKYGYYGYKYDYKIVIWNPLIKKYKKLPNEPDIDYDKHN